MKKHFVLGALAVLALAACTKSEVIELNKGNEISLTAVTGKNLTKAADGYCNNSLPGDFQVWAATQGKSYFENQKYKDQSGTYIADGAARYWPEGSATVDFFATKNHNGTVTKIGNHKAFKMFQNILPCIHLSERLSHPQQIT